MHSRFSVPVLILCAGMAFVAPVSAALRDPAVDGRNHLLSDRELHALLPIARQRVARIAPSCHVVRLKVISQTKVEAYFCEEVEEHTSGILTLEKIKGEWRITHESGPGERVIVT
jgi:hypothetical protein